METKNELKKINSETDLTRFVNQFFYFELGIGKVGLFVPALPFIFQKEKVGGSIYKDF